jgi:uncharacterized membrane protein (UPF0127 family)
LSGPPCAGRGHGPPDAGIDSSGLHIFVAQTFRQRLLGLHAYLKLPWHTGLCIRPCNAIHTAGLAYAIDVVFLDKRLQIAKRVDCLPPWRAAICLKAACVVELPAGYCAAYPDHPQRIRRALQCAQP